MITRRKVILSLCISLGLTLLLCQGYSSFAQGAQLEESHNTTTTLDQPSQPRLVAQEGHPTGLDTVAVSSSSRLVLTRSLDGKAILWDTATGRQIRRFDDVASVAISGDGKYVVTGGRNGGVDIWATTTGAIVPSFIAPFIKTDGVARVAISGDGTYVVTGSGRVAVLYQRITGFPIQWFKIPYGFSFASIAISANGKYLVTVSTDSIARVWNTETGDEIDYHYRRSLPTVGSVAISADGKFVVTSDYNTAELWDTTTGIINQGIVSYSDHISSVAISAGSKYVVTVWADGTARVWDAKTAKEIQRFEAHYNNYNSLAISADSKFIVTAWDDGTARLWDAETNKEIHQFKVYGGKISSVTISMDGKYIVTGSKDGKIKLWDAKTQNMIREFTLKDTSKNSYKSLALSISQNDKYIVSRFGGTAQLWNAETGEEINLFEGVERYSHIPGVFSPDSKFVLIFGNEGEFQLRDTAAGNEACKFTGHTARVTSVAFPQNGTTILTVSADETSRLWNAFTGVELLRFDSEGIVESAAISPNGKNVVTGGKNGNTLLWDVEKRSVIRRLEGSLGDVTAVAFSSDGRFILTGSKGNTRWYDAATGNILQQYNSIRRITSVGISDEGKHIVIGSGDGTTRLWDVGKRKFIGLFDGHGEIITSVAISSDGKYVLAGSRDGTARLWDAFSSMEIRRFEGYISSITSFAISSRGRYIAVGNETGIAHTWDTKTGKEISRIKESFEHSGLPPSSGINSREWNNISGIAISTDGRYLVTRRSDEIVTIWDTAFGHSISHFVEPGLRISRDIAISSGGEYILLAKSGKGFRRCFSEKGGCDTFSAGLLLVGTFAFTSDGSFVLDHNYLLNAMTGERIRVFAGHNGGIDFVAISSNNKFVVIVDSFGVARIWDIGKDDPIQEFQLSFGSLNSQKFWGAYEPLTGIDISSDGKYLVALLSENACLWDISAGKELRRFTNVKAFNSVAFSPDGKYVLLSKVDGTIVFWDVATENVLLQIFNFRDDTWAMVAPDGRFDTNNLENIRNLQWFMPDDPLYPLPAEIFMRDYYEPQLLPKLLSGTSLKSIRPLSGLNRVQPQVKILKVEQGETPEIAKVTVEVSGAKKPFHLNGKDVQIETGVHDLRLYRNGQLVAQWPDANAVTFKDLNTTSQEELDAWRKATEIILDETGKATKTFTVILQGPYSIPMTDSRSMEDWNKVVFTAYAFNEDRVKSETDLRPYAMPAELEWRQGRSYIITVGVSGNEDMAWRLSFASEDAKLIQRTVVKELKRSDKKVVPVCLISTPPGPLNMDVQEECREFIWPTKENIKMVLDLLAGKKVDSLRLEQIPIGIRNNIQRVQPEDLVLLTFSSHGLTDVNGEFYILPYDLGMGSGGKVTPDLLNRSISSHELSLWLSPLDAEQMFMVIDACHSAAAIDVKGFKPGPMGNPGLGQLSYDKKMPILTATQATDSAWAKGYSLLSYALAKEGIEEKKANRFGQIAFTDAFKYAEARVPKLYKEMMGIVKEGQVPKLFDFKLEQAIR